MRELHWDEMFARRGEEGEADLHQPPRGWAAAIGTWEEWLTFAVVVTVFLSVVVSVQQAKWVHGMPALVPMALVGLALGFGLSRLRVPEPLIHLFALPSLCGFVLLRLLADLPGDTPRARFAVLLQRMHGWFYAAFHNGVSSDPLPVIMLVLVLITIGAYLTAWSVFRWQNPWLGLVPGGAVMLANISYLPGQFSFAFVVFLFGAVLLLMRLHLTRQERRWQKERVPYPGFISLSVFNVTLWVAVAILLLAWMVPLANRAGPLGRAWDRLYRPLEDRSATLARVFNSVDPKKPITIHNFQDFMAFEGMLQLRGKHTDIRVQGNIPPGVVAYLRARAYDVYGDNGWGTGEEQQVDLPASASSDAGGKDRQQVTIQVEANGNDSVLFSLGQPLAAQDAQAAEAAGPGDFQVLTPDRPLGKGDSYSVTGSVSTASEDELRAAGTDYPDWASRYTQLPDNLPADISRLAHDLARYQGTPYDRATAIESYLRTYPIDNNVPAPPKGRDPVEYFLFEARRGYFDYHASAMVVMLRTLGIPSRLAVGYVLGGSRDENNNLFASVDETAAFAWPEVYFPGYGWLEFNPTPSQPAILRPGSYSSSSGSDPTGPGLRNLEIPTGELPVLPVTPGPDLPQYQASGGGGAFWSYLFVVAGLLGALVVVGGGMRLAWGFGLGGLDYPSQVWEKTVRLAGLSRLRPAPQQTPREFARRLQAETPDIGPVEALAQAYERTRFGRKAVDPGERAGLEAMWREVRRGLLRRALRKGMRR